MITEYYNNEKMGSAIGQLSGSHSCPPDEQGLPDSNILMCPYSGMQDTITDVHNTEMDMDMAPSVKDPTYSQGFSEKADIHDFLSRPVQVFQDTFSVGSTARVGFDPWLSFLSNPAVLKKIDNYSLLRGNLVITVYINATPQHSGLYILAYNKMRMGVESGTALGEEDLIQLSQRDHIYLSAPDNQGGCMELPFFYPLNFLPAGGAVTPGYLNLQGITSLKQLSGGSTPVTITVFAHMKDVVLTAPSTMAFLDGIPDVDLNLEPYSKTRTPVRTNNDEYEQKGPVSKIASNVAKAAGLLSNIPRIKEFALATQMAATGIGSVASAFGYSKPASIDDVQLMRNTPLANMALAEGKDTCSKLTLTAKQEITIDPNTVGLDSTDEMALDFLKKKESYVTQFDYTPAQFAGNYIFAIAATPNHYRLLGDDKCIPTHLDFLSRPFGYWSGSLKFRFVVIGTKFHRGRVAIVYDPATYPGSVEPYNTTFTTIIDMSENRDVTITVPWMNANPYLPTDQDYEEGSSFTTTAPESYYGGPYANGSLYVKVVNELNSPDDITPMTIAVFVSAGDDFELANPIGRNIQDISFYPTDGPVDLDLQMEPFSEEGHAVDAADPMSNHVMEGTDVQLGSPKTYDDVKSLVFFGESVTSIRQLMKRYSFFRYQKMDNSANSSAYSIYYMDFPSFPRPFGHLSNGRDTFGTPAVKGDNVCTSYMMYFMRAFAGWRGSTRYKIVPTSAESGSSLTVIRDVDFPNKTAFKPTGFSMSQAGDISEALAVGAQIYDSSVSGTVDTNRNMLCLEYELPYTRPQRFSTTDFYDGVFGTNDEYWHRIVYNSCSKFHPADAWKMYTAVGDDFSLFGWNNAPPYVFSLQRT